MLNGGSADRGALRARIPFVPLFTAIVALALFAWLVRPRQEGDASFDLRVADPAYAGDGPRVYFDQGH